MKKIIFSLVMIAFTLSSCESFLEENPKGRLTPDVMYNDANGLNMAINGLYNRFMETQRVDRRHIYMWSGDDVTSKNTGNKTRMAEYDRFYFTSLNEELVDLWNVLWACIKPCNNIIANGESMDIDPTFLQHRLGQAYFIRALTYFYLVRLWGRIPLVTEVEIDYTTPRASVEEVYALIEADLDKAEAYLPDRHTSTSAIAPYFRDGINLAPNKAAAKALRASVWMTQAGWPLEKGTSYYDMAAGKYKEIIDREAEYGYILEPDIWTLVIHPRSNFSREIVFGCFLQQNNGFDHGYREIPEESSGWSDIMPQLDLFYDFPEGPRKDAYFNQKVFIGSGTTGVCVPWDDLATMEMHPYFKKNILNETWITRGFNLETGDWNMDGFSQNGKTRYVFRYADILLLYAEAVAFGSGFENASEKALAFNCVERVQTRAGVPDDRKINTGMTKAEFQKAVLDERRWETCGFEISAMGRFFTMQRHKILHLQGAYRIWNPNDPERRDISKVDIFDSALNPNLTLSEEYYYMPIPASELMIVPDLNDR